MLKSTNINTEFEGWALKAAGGRVTSFVEFKIKDVLIGWKKTYFPSEIQKLLKTHTFIYLSDTDVHRYVYFMIILKELKQNLIWRNFFY